MNDLTLQKKLALWDWVDRHHPEWWDRPNHPGIRARGVPAMLRRVVDEAVASVRTHEATIIKWLSDPSEHTPHVDEVALRRALDFDWEAIRNLTALERSMFYGRLADMADPWSKGEQDTPNGAVEVEPSPRRRRFLSATEAERGIIKRSVHRARTVRRAA